MAFTTDARSILAALGAAVFFGASTPFAKALLGTTAPIVLAGLLYLGSGTGLWWLRLLRDRGLAPTGMARGEWPWFAGAIVSGGVLGPVLLMYGLTHTSAADASLLLNLEAVLTALLAWIVFAENTDRRIVLGMALIVAGGALLAWPRDRAAAHGGFLGAMAIAAACLCWAVDNNLTRKVSASDPLFIAAAKGLVAGLVNLSVATSFGATLPGAAIVADSMLVGFVGYGVSLVLFVYALRGLGTARTGAYFATAPFIGAALAIGLFHEHPSGVFWPAAALMIIGLWLHLSERHAHEHTHEPLTHSHAHRHDSHHQHEHAFAWDGREPHTHEHKHEPLTHTHIHYPDVHHRHGH